MAIALVEFLESEDLDCRIQMFGTDVSDTTIDKARAGIYSESTVMNVSAERSAALLRSHRLRIPDQPRHSRNVHVFTAQCRQRSTPVADGSDQLPQSPDLLLAIAYSAASSPRSAMRCNRCGCLILGSSETLGSFSEYFLTLDEPHKIYCKKPNVSQHVFHISETSGEDADGRSSSPGGAAFGWRPRASNGPLQRVTSVLELSRYGPVGVVVNETLADHGVPRRRGRVPVYAGNGPGCRPDEHSPAGAASRGQHRHRTGAPHRSSCGFGELRLVRTGDIPSPVAITVVPLSMPGDPAALSGSAGRSSETALREMGASAAEPESRAPFRFPSRRRTPSSSRS